MQYEKCAELFARNGLPISPEVYEKLQAYAELLLAEAENQNVTALKTDEEIWTRHFLDSAFLLKYIPAGMGIDLGTGGGIPAIPLAVMNPALEISMLDSELRKIEFCRSVIAKLDIHAETYCGRAEELGRSALRNQFDFVVSRAMANGSWLCEFGIPMLRTGGRLFAMKGRQFDPEAERFDSAAAALGAVTANTIRYELEGEPKHLIIMEKQSETPAQYPRRFAKMKRAPL